MRDINLVMISQGASEINLSMVIDESQVDEAVRRLHKQFFESVPALDLFEQVGGI
jgi:aspartate kinase